MSDCRVLVTGAAGFIGFHVSQRLLAALSWGWTSSTIIMIPG
jgi:nucleoside-diphosphate-sugar epimerase